MTVAILDTAMGVEELDRSERQDQVELISRKPGAEAVNIQDETPFTPKPLVILFGGADVRRKEQADIVHTPQV
jgi:hypothetical protein